MKRKQTLLQKAQNSPLVRQPRTKRRVDAEEIDLAVAYIKGRVSRSQALEALGIDTAKNSESQRLINWTVTTLRLAGRAKQLHIERIP